MENIKYVKSCCNSNSLVKILKDGYLRSQKGLNIKDYDLDVAHSDPTKVFLQIDFWNWELQIDPIYYDEYPSLWIKPLDYGTHCFLLNKKILQDRNDYMINNGWKGSINENTLKKPKNFKNLKIDPFQNEVLFNNKISLSKYLEGVIIGIQIDDKNDIRIDLIHDRFCTFKKYAKVMKQKFSNYSESVLKRNYKKGKIILNAIKKYTETIFFKHLPAGFEPTEKIYS